MSIALESLVPDPSTPAVDDAGVFGQFARFVLVGGSGALAFVVLSNLVIAARLLGPNWLASTLCHAALILPVYLLHRRFTFASDAPHARALPRYAGVQLVSLGLAALFSFVAYGVFGMPTLWASLLVTALTAGVSFLVLKLWAFAAAERRAPLAAPLPADRRA